MYRIEKWAFVDVSFLRLLWLKPYTVIQNDLYAKFNPYCMLVHHFCVFMSIFEYGMAAID